MQAQAEVRGIQEQRASTRSEAPPLVSVRALMLAGAFPLIPADKVPPSVRNPGALYGEFTPVTLLQGLGEGASSALQLGSSALKAVGRAVTGRESSSSEGPATENGSAVADGGSRPGSAPAPAASPVAASAASKPRRQPPPPPPKMP